MSGLWMAGMLAGAAADVTQPRASTASDVSMQVSAHLKEIEHQIGRLALLNQALWELVRERLHLSDADLERLATEIDLRDGRADGAISNQALRCPSCGRISNSKHHKCLYCGQLFEASLFG